MSIQPIRIEMNIKKYLEKLQGTEAVGGFAIDSFPTKKKKKKRQVISVAYPNENWIMVEQMSRRAMIDLDGTIHKYSKGYEDGTIYDDPFEGAKKVIDWLKNNGYEIVIFTTRASEENAKETGGDHIDQIRSVENWLKLNGIYFDRVTAEKLAADFYIDDKAIFIKDGNWDAVFKTIKKRMKFG
jgi:hypothetical protein